MKNRRTLNVRSQGYYVKYKTETKSDRESGKGGSDGV